MNVVATGIDDPVFANAGPVIGVAKLFIVFGHRTLADDFKCPVRGADDFHVAFAVRHVMDKVLLEAFPEHGEHVQIVRNVRRNVGNQDTVDEHLAEIKAFIQVEYCSSDGCFDGCVRADFFLAHVDIDLPAQEGDAQLFGTGLGERPGAKAGERVSVGGNTQQGIVAELAVDDHGSGR